MQRRERGLEADHVPLYRRALGPSRRVGSDRARTGPHQDRRCRAHPAEALAISGRQVAHLRVWRPARELDKLFGLVAVYGVDVGDYGSS